MKHLSSLNKYFWKYRWYFLLGFVFVVLTNYFRILAPQLTGYVVNTVVQSVKSSNVNEIDIKKSERNYDFAVREVISKFEANPGNKILYAGVTLFVIAIISGFFMFLMRQTIIVMSRHIEYDQKNEIFAHYQKLDTHFYKTHSTGDLMNRIADDVSKVRMYTGPAIMYFINLAAVLGFSIFFMLKASPKLTLVALAPLPVLAIAIYLVNTIINRKSERIQALLSDLTTNAQESYSGIRVIKSFIQEKAMLGFFTKNSLSYRDNALSLAKTEAIYFPSMALLIGLSTLITIMVGSLDVINEVEGASVGRIAEFVMYIQMLTFPVSAIGWTASMTQRAATSQRRINEFLHTEPGIENEALPVNTSLKGNISINNLSFTYPHTGIKALQDFSLQIRAGDKIAVIGRTGSGKSTLAQLLLHMYEPQQGLISYDDVPINKFDIQALRLQISYVPQDIFLFSETVKNNIRFGMDDATDDAVIQAAKQASIHNEIEHFSAGYNTMIGERGVTLSGGQKQRISIARALIKDPKIVIFDDCLSAVDARTEKEIIGNLYRFLNQKTAIIITHRIFSLFDFDKIIVLHDGRIVESGKHLQLLEQNGYYADMYRRQQEQDKETG
ncbi:MAG: ABC transporter ATP-binding protein [Chitinophagaceae bacterium]|nr:ABC transporter ATP-binding protein [Chitinophagaceae bacterium]